MARIRVRARTLDMLGRQQMASIPNALHELYKNAHDAYADNARIDYYRRDGILILHDDGVGMTLEDFESRWLTLGTESKLAGTAMRRPYRDPNKPYRHPLGEKGIGRLAIASVGPQVLILSRAERENGLRDLVASFINWTFFEAPGLDLDDIEIPTLTLPRGILPDLAALRSLVDDIRKNLGAIGPRLPAAYRDRVAAELESFTLSLPRSVELVARLPLAEARGTAFLIHPVDPMLERDLEEGSDELPAPLLKILRGFANTMIPQDAPPPLLPTFYDHDRDGATRELIGEKEFFRPEEFLSADQHIEGEFDEYGQFTGYVSVYRQAPRAYTVPWDGARGEPTRCGSFRINFAYLQGRPEESLVPSEAWSALSDKLNQFGGLYVYRDGVRVLPYGNSDFDWLNIERRRTKAAKDWYFSYRRLFGAVELSTPANAALVEKAGREGFRENAAYRQFRDMLENLFKQLAYDWFREKTARYGNYRERLTELQQRDALLKKREKTQRGRKDQLKKALDAFFNDIERDKPERRVNELRETMNRTLAGIAGLSPEEAARELLRLESEMLTGLQELRDRYRIARPRGLALAKTVQQDLARSAAVFIQLEKTLFYPFERDVSAGVTRVISETKALISHRKRIRQVLEQRNKEEAKRANAVIREAREGTRNLQQEVLERTREGLSHLTGAFNKAFMALEREDLAALDDDGIESFRRSLDEQLARQTSEELDNLERLNEQIRSTLDAVRTGLPAEEITAALEERSEELAEQVERYTELAQLGSAIGIIQHEFEAAVNGIRLGLRTLGKEASDNPGLFVVCRNLRTHFEHLDSYLTLFTPLNRRLYRKPIPISGKEIREYILQIFEERFKRHHIGLTSSSAFEGHSVTAFPATFLPAFINIVDNAVFWLSRDSTGAKRALDASRLITFDADAKGFLIGNNGPGIEERDADRIFEFSFTRKLRGRGMGLAVARRALNEAGYDLRLEACGRNTPPVFRITTERNLPANT